MRKKLDFDVTESGCFISKNHLAKVVKGNHVAGRIRRNGSSVSMSRWIYEEMFGPLPQNLVVRHTCANGNCINPEHLISGTHRQNMQDMIDQGRNTNGPRILDEEKVLEIRGLIKLGYTSKSIAKIYGVQPSTISDIRQNRTWTPENIERRLKARQAN